MGTVLMAEAAYARAAEHFRFASISSPGDLQARLKLASCMLETGHSDAAMALLRPVAGGGPQHFAMSLKLVLTSGRGRFWLKPSAAARAFAERD
jgi:thioredoxin-like negative regulator of GroEL